MIQNNDILRRIRYTFDYNDSSMIDLFSLGSLKVNRAELSNWLKKEEDPNFKALSDLNLAIFLNGLIVEKRGKREGNQPIPENRLNNNIIFRKLKVALNLNTNEIMQIFKSIDKEISAHELSAFFRNPKQSKYRSCNDQYLRNFLSGIQKEYRK